MALKPWREVVVPHPDVASGDYDQAEFAADLAQVVAGTADPEYQDAREFFARTYLTEGMRRLLVTAVRRLTGGGGAPIVQLKTAFGGGKTHTMLALYHLLSQGGGAAQMEGTGAIMREAGVDELPTARLAVIVGVDLSPSETRRVNGITVRTLWGNIAAHSSGVEEAYNIVKAADESGVAHRSAAIWRPYSINLVPAVILIDELVAYARNIYGDNNRLPSGSFDSIMTFVHALTEAVKRSERCQLVASIPESDIEIGGEAGQAALERIEHTFGRLEDIWRPVGAREGFEVVRRRLFSPVKDETARDAVCRGFIRLYDENPSDFPTECREGGYIDRLRQAYPIHPELFDRLYDDWSTLERFQRTRGVLRLMAAVIHQLWSRDDRSLLIMPGSIAIDAPRVREELLRYLPEGWNAVVDKDVDGDSADPRAIDAENSRFGAISAARRVARTIFMGSAPHVRQQTARGIEDVRIRLGVAQPGEMLSVYNDATGRMTDRLTHLYTGSHRYWYDTQPNLRRTMEDRAVNLEAEEVTNEIVRRLRGIRERGDFSAVHPCPNSEMVPDEPTARLVILSPASVHRGRQGDSAALRAANEILDKRGDSPRTFRNMLLFLAPDVDQWPTLEKEVRRYLAWGSIIEDADALNLDTHQRREASRFKSRSNETLGMCLNETYCWLLIPTQEGTDPIRWEETRIAGPQDNPVAKAVQKVRSDEQIIKQWSPALLKMELDKWLWKEEDHISLKRVWECLATYLYMPRLSSSDVLLDAVREGIRTREFGYANILQDNGKYAGLQFENVTGSIYLDEHSVLVKPDIAKRQLLAESDPPPYSPDPVPPVPPDPDPGGGTSPDPGGTPTPSRPKRFYGSVELNPVRASRDAQNVINEVVQHIASRSDVDVTVTIEVQATFGDGVPEDLERILTENCHTLGFNAQEFEDE